MTGVQTCALPIYIAVADKLRLQPDNVQEMFKEEFSPASERIDMQEKEIKAITLKTCS